MADEPQSYFAATERPIAAAAFVLPMVAAYEWGTRAWATEACGGERRIVAFNLVRQGFGLAGPAGQRLGEALGPWLPAVAVVAALVGAHLVRRDRWRVRPAHAAGMLAESVALAAPLLAVGIVMTTYARLPAVSEAVESLASRVPGVTLAASDAGRASTDAAADPPAEAGSPGRAGFAQLLVLSVGAGVYEELVFRLFGFAALHLLLADVLRLPSRAAGVGTIALSAVAFAGYHHVGFAGAEPFDAGVFAFRTAAGVWFGAVYAARGFGVAAGCHAAYDVLVVALAAAHA